MVLLRGAASMKSIRSIACCVQIGIYGFSLRDRVVDILDKLVWNPFDLAHEMSPFPNMVFRFYERSDQAFR